MMRVLLVEDNPDDTAAVERLAARSALALVLTAISNGHQVVEYLSGRGPDANAPLERPDLILLDIGLPGLPGLELLRRIKADTRWQDIPVVVLSGSDRDADVRQAGALGAHSHLTKPLRAADFDWMTAAVAAYHVRVRRALRASTVTRCPNALGIQSSG